MTTPNPHDALFKATFSDPEHAAGELEHVLPQQLAQHIDWATLELQPGSFVDAALRDRHSDLLYSVHIAGREARLYVLLEHQSTADPWMPWRLLTYMVRIWERFRRERPDATRLPAIIPVVLFHGQSPWTAPTRLHELIDLEGPALAAAAKHIPAYEMLLDDLSAQDDPALRGRAMSALGRIVLWCLKHGHTEALLAELPRWVGVFREVLQASTDAEALAAVMRYIRLRTQKKEPGQVEQVLGRLLGPQVREVYVTEGERLIQQGLEKGLEKGVERGRRGLLLHQLAQRFGPLPDWVHARLDSAPSDHIDRFAERVLTASTLDEVFGGA